MGLNLLWPVLKAKIAFFVILPSFQSQIQGSKPVFSFQRDLAPPLFAITFPESKKFDHYRF